MAYYDVMRDVDFEMLIKLNKTKSRVILYHKYKISYPISAYHYIDESQMDDYMVEGSIGEMRPSNQPPPLPRARNSTKDACLPVAEQRVVIDLGDDGYEVPSLQMFAKPEESEIRGYQFGFQEGKSTHMVLITLVDKITEALDKGDYGIGVFLGFAKAFDTVDHSILLAKMFSYGIRDLALQWFKDYLTGRVQFVTYNGFKSSNGEIKCAVPQGSILGPLLFLTYISMI